MGDLLRGTVAAMKAALGHVWETTTAAYIWLLGAVYAAAVVVGFVWHVWLGLALLVPAVLAFLIWRDS
jgi:hypothetical protein